MAEKELDPINKRIAKYRTLAGFTQETAAQALGMKKNTYARMERYGYPKPDMLKKMASLFGVTTELILYGKTFLEILKEPTTTTYVRLEQPIKDFHPDPPITLTTNEKNLVKACRELSGKDRNELMAMIREYYENHKPEDK